MKIVIVGQGYVGKTAKLGTSVGAAVEVGETGQLEALVAAPVGVDVPGNLHTFHAAAHGVDEPRDLHRPEVFSGEIDYTSLWTIARYSCKDHGVASIEWKSLSQVSMLSPGTASGTLLQLSGKLLSDALKVQTFDAFVRTALSEIASELSVQWIGLVQRVPGPGWNTIAEHGQQALSIRPVSLWDEALDRDSAGISNIEQGKILASFPLTANTPFAHLMVTAGRHADAAGDAPSA